MLLVYLRELVPTRRQALIMVIGAAASFFIGAAGYIAADALTNDVITLSDVRTGP